MIKIKKLTTLTKDMGDNDCIVCGDEITGSGEKYCSFGCMGEDREGMDNPAAKKEKGEAECAVCGQKFEFYKSNRESAKLCSNKCKSKYYSQREPEEHPHWKGDNAEYSALHRRLRENKGQPKKCEECGTEDPDKTYDWANISGDYEDPDDYKRLCRSCHWKLDNTVENLETEEVTEKGQ